jgi:RNA polymerase sigma-70 factor (ECF subfamily)
MAIQHEPDTEELLELAKSGDATARHRLLIRHQKRLQRMVALRMDRRLAARVDASDVVQEAMTDAARKLSDYLRDRPLPFYPWLRQLACDKLIDLYRRHVRAGKRSVTREEAGILDLPEDSAIELAARLAVSASPSQRMLQKEIQQRVQAALKLLSDKDRAVLELRHLEQLSVAETAAVIGISLGAVKTRHLRALRRLRDLLGIEEDNS